MNTLLEFVPCRLFFILARNADMGVIFRRGPSKWVQIVRWDTAHDTFEPGQWFHGRIYEKRSDLSPDGTKMIYFAQKINRRTLEDREYTYAWTAISKPPFLTALALWPKGDCWHGGGRFETDRRVWLNHRPVAAMPHPNHKPQGLKVVDNPQAHGEDDPVFWPRLERDGWKRQQEWDVRWTGRRYLTQQPMIHEKPCPNEPMTLVMTSSIVEFAHVVEFTVRHNGERITLEGAEWADWDQRGRLVFTRAGKLLTGSVDENSKVREKELADFNAWLPDNKKTPAWARRW